MAIPSFLFGGETGQTPESLARQRRVLEAMAMRGIGAPKNVGEGLTAIGNAIAYRMAKGDLAKGETAQRERRDALMAPLFGGGAASYVDPNASASAGASASIPSSDVGSELAATDPTPASFSGNQQEFIESILPAAIEEGQRTGVDPRIIVAQAAQETGWGKSAPGNNFFGIKSHGQDGGNSLMTTEYVDGQPVKMRDSFRAYGSPAESVRGYGDFITQNPRYKPLREAQGLDNQLAALQASGYATDPNYSRSVGSIARGIKLPDQVASLDPSAGMPPAAAAIETQAPGSGYVDPTVSTPNYDPSAANPRQAVAGALAALPPKQPQFSPAVTTVGNAMAARTAPGTEAPPLPPGTDVGPAPAVAGLPPQPMQAAPAAMPQQQAPQQQVAGNGYFPPAPAPASSGPSLAQLMQMSASPDLGENDRAIVNGLIQQRMQTQAARERVILEQRLKQSDPSYQAELEKTRLETEALRNPKLSPADQARIDLDKQKFNFERNEPTGTMREYDAYAADERSAGRMPIGRLDYEQALKKAGSSSTNVTVGEGDSFYKELDKKNAETFNTLSQSGMEARGKIARIDRLEGLMANAPQGAVGALKQAAGDWGIPTEGLSDIQAASALLEKMVPEQRLPGSGTMSDGDIKMFRASLPRVINQPGGNQLIFQTMRGIAQYEQQMGEIADRVANREINPAEGRRQIQALPNPLAEFKIPSGPTPNEGWKEIAPGVRVRKVD